MTAGQYKNYKGLRKESLRDNMSDLEIALDDLGELATREIAKSKKPQGLEQNKAVAHLGGHSAKVAKDDIEKNIGKSVITNKNRLSYKYTEEIDKIENK